MFRNKIKKISRLLPLISVLKKKNKKIVFTNGCFDIIHYGHVMYLEKAKAMGDILIVAVNSDSSVRKIKGAKRPLVSEKDRAAIIAALESVDYVTIFRDKTPYKIIEKIKPDILVKGGDWDKTNIAGSDFVKERGGKTRLIKIVSGRSTTNLIKKIVKRYGQGNISNI
ncbi:MAG: D-glycero-beta-D-manno-heptose 1-phosphate adenylyltransferase [Candidatus Omnitrophica bacterium]|nr:D-glycero-beta-D-manno-heptose 1-phosphate adenylyltransferase [Candidatus Omnitrophota bacterium]